MEADRPKVVSRQTGFDGRGAGRPVRRTERLHPSAAPAFRQERVNIPQSFGQRPDERIRDERHVPGDGDHRRRGFEDCRQDAAERSETRAHVGDDPEIGTPGPRIGRVGHEQRKPAKGVLERLDQVVENANTADELQPLGPAAEPGRAASGENGAACAG